MMENPTNGILQFLADRVTHMSSQPYVLLLLQLSAAGQAVRSPNTAIMIFQQRGSRSIEMAQNTQQMIEIPSNFYCTHSLACLNLCPSTVFTRKKHIATRTTALMTEK